MVIEKYRFYKKEDYPTEKVSLSRLPQKIEIALMNLILDFRCCLRGGAALALHLDNVGDFFTDIDFTVLNKDKQQLFNKIAPLADEHFYNLNAFGNEFLTLFWASDKQRFYRMDLLFSDILPMSVQKRLLLKNDFVSVETATLPWIFADKLHKIATAKKRAYDKSKILKHKRSINTLSGILLKNEKLISTNADLTKSNIKKWATQSYNCLFKVLPETDLRKFEKNVKFVIERWED